MVLDGYEQIRAGLATDDFRLAKRSAAALATALKGDSHDASSARLLGQVQAVADAKALDIAREWFEPLSASLEPLAAGVDGYYIMTSPNGMGGDWIQRTPTVDNPYMGQTMHDAGSLKK